MKVIGIEVFPCPSGSAVPQLEWRLTFAVLGKTSCGFALTRFVSVICSPSSVPLSLAAWHIFSARWDHAEKWTWRMDEGYHVWEPFVCYVSAEAEQNRVSCKSDSSAFSSLSPTLSTLMVWSEYRAKPAGCTHGKLNFFPVIWHFLWFLYSNYTKICCHAQTAYMAHSSLWHCQG